MGAQGTQIPSIVIVAMVVILVFEEQTMRRGHPPFPAVLTPPWYSLDDVETGPTRLPPSYHWSNPSVEVPLILRWRGGRTVGPHVCVRKRSKGVRVLHSSKGR